LSAAIRLKVLTTSGGQEVSCYGSNIDSNNKKERCILVGGSYQYIFFKVCGSRTMLRPSCLSAAAVFFGGLALLLLLSFGTDSRLASLEIYSSLRKTDDREKIKGIADDEAMGSVTFSGKDKAAEKNVKRIASSDETSQPEPSLAWLMSFPNSGTSYTMSNTESISGRSTATNYATEIPEDRGDPVPLRRHNDEEGIDSGPWQRNTDLPLPSKRVLCKTHCTGYDDGVSVVDSVLSFDEFFNGCRESLQKRDKTNPSAKRNKLRAHYPAAGLLDSAIHLIRDPFDNIISRMHLGFRNQYRTNYADMTAEELEAFMKSKDGVNAWCKTVDANFWKTQKGHVTGDMKISNETLSLLPYDATPYLHVPCHGEFFRYTQWHNYAVELIKKRNLAVLTVHYENYGTTYNRTVDQILDFLGQSREHEPRPFKTGKTYRDAFFDNSVQHEIKHLIKEIASEETWALLRRYFTSPHKDDETDNRD
jgi:hypothetical protein